MQFATGHKRYLVLITIALFLVTGFVLVSCNNPKQQGVAASGSGSNAFNSDHFDLTNWKLTLPVADDDGKALEVKKLEKFDSAYFYSAPDGAMVFKAPVEGSKTKNTKYPRSELRERPNGKDAEWNLSEGGTMTATLKVDQAPSSFDGKPGRMVVGQIHGEDHELIRLYWDNGDIYFQNDQAGDDDKEYQFLLHDAGGQTPRVALGQKFSYKIDAHGDTLDVRVYVDGHEYTSKTKINPVWQSDKLYFKAGIYLGVNAKQHATGVGQVSFYALDYSHTPGSGLGGLSR